MDPFKTVVVAMVAVLGMVGTARRGDDLVQARPHPRVRG